MDLHLSLKSCRMSKPSNEILTCRICFAIGGRHGFVAPCSCDGNKKWVHRTCLDAWRCIKDDSAFSRCTVCHKPFTLVCVTNGTDKDKTMRRLKLAWYCLRDFGLSFALSQITIVLVGGLFAYTDGGRLIHDLGMVDHPYIVYYIVGLLLSLVFLGIAVHAIKPLSEPDSNTVIVCTGCEGCHGLWCYPYPYTPDQELAQCRFCEGRDYYPCAGNNCSDMNPIVLVGIFAFVYLFLFTGKTIWYLYYSIEHHYRVLVKMTLAEEYIVSDFADQHRGTSPASSEGKEEYQPPPSKAEEEQEEDVENVILYDHNAGGATGGGGMSEVKLHSDGPKGSIMKGFTWGRGQQLQQTAQGYAPVSNSEDGLVRTKAPGATTVLPAPQPFEQRQRLLSNGQRLELVSFGLL